MRRASGFTLIELLIGLGIFSILSLLAYGGLQAALTSTARSGEHLNRIGQLQRTIGRLGMDLEQLVDRPVRDRYGETLAALAASSSREASLELTHGGLANPAAIARSPLQRVRYRLEGRQLLRERWNRLDRSTADEPRQQLMLDGVESLGFRFLGEDGRWSDQWPAGNDDGLPRGIELTLEVAGVGTIRRLWAPRG